MANNQVEVEITVEERQALRALTMLTKSIDSTEKKAIKSFSKMDMAISSFAGNLAANATSALVSFARQGLSVATTELVDFDLAIREINTLLPKTAKVTGKLKDELIEISARFGSSQTEQAKAYYQIISSGAATGAAAMQLLNDANTLAVGGISDVGSSINLLTDILNIYGAENINAADAADTLFTTVRLGKTTIPELTSTLGAVLPSAKKLGLSLEDVGSALAAMTVQGLTTAERTTQLNALFTALFKKSGDSADKFGKDVSAAFSTTALKAKGLAKFLEDLQVATGGNEETLAQLLGRTEAVRAVFALTGDGADILADKIEGMAGKAGSANEAFEEIEGSLSKQFNIALQNVTNTLTKMLGPLSEVARVSLKIFNSMFEDGRKADEKIADLEATISRLNNNLKKNDNFYTHFLGKNREEDEKALANAITQLKELRAAASSAMGPQPLPVADESSGNGDVVKKQVEIYDELNAIRAQQAIVEMENELRAKEARALLNEEELQELRDLESAKFEIARDFALEKASFIVDTDKRRRAQDKINAEYELNAEKLLGKRKIEISKREAATQLSIRRSNFQTAQNFLAAGQALMENGSKGAQALASFSSLLSTYQAATAALAPPPLGLGPVAGIPLAASVTAIGLANVAKINGASFETGGVIGGFNGASLGRDNTIANVRNGEMVLTGSQQKQLFNDISSGNSGNSEILAAVKSMANTPIILTVDNREIARANRTAIQEGFSAA